MKHDELRKKFLAGRSFEVARVKPALPGVPLLAVPRSLDPRAVLHDFLDQFGRGEGNEPERDQRGTFPLHHGDKRLRVWPAHIPQGAHNVMVWVVGTSDDVHSRPLVMSVLDLSKEVSQ